MRTAVLSLIPLACLLLDGCGELGPLATAQGGGPGVEDGLYCPAAAGPLGVELIVDDESHAPVEDGATYVIAQRPQGDVTVYAPLAFQGIDGGTVVTDLAMTFVDEEGAERGARRSSRFQIPCEDDDEVAGHWYEVFFGNPSIPPSTYDGLDGELAVSFKTSDGVVVEDVVLARLSADLPEAQ